MKMHTLMKCNILRISGVLPGAQCSKAIHLQNYLYSSLVNGGMPDLNRRYVASSFADTVAANVNTFATTRYAMRNAWKSIQT